MAVAVFGLLVHSLLVIRAGLLMVGIGALAGSGIRLLAWESLRKRVPVLGLVGIGVQIAAAVGIFIVAVKVHL